MAFIWDNIAEKYKFLFDDLKSPITKDWFLVSSPLPLIIILIIYNVFCTKIGPELMKHRQPFKLETPIKIYNIFQVIISAYLTYEGYVYIFSGKFNFECQGVREEDVRVARGFQVYLITKLIELLDTIFFVLRKSNRQITFLHLFHHTLMPMVTWYALKYYPGGQGAIIGAINSLVHVFMYSYYLISSSQKNLWWKKYLTIMQIVQFLIVLLHSFKSTFYTCDYPHYLKIFAMTFASIFIYMFSTFYYVNYVMRKPNSNETNKFDKGHDHSFCNGRSDAEDISANGALKPNVNGVKVGNKTNGSNNAKSISLSGNGKSKAM